MENIDKIAKTQELTKLEEAKKQKKLAIETKIELENYQKAKNKL